jgi:hypothetical protein
LPVYVKAPSCQVPCTPDRFMTSSPAPKRTRSHHQLVRSARAKRRPHTIGNRVARIDVAHKLSLALRRVRSIAKKNDLRLLLPVRVSSQPRIFRAASVRPSSLRLPHLAGIPFPLAHTHHAHRKAARHLLAGCLKRPGEHRRRPRETTTNSETVPVAPATIMAATRPCFATVSKMQRPAPRTPVLVRHFAVLLCTFVLCLSVCFPLYLSRLHFSSLQVSSSARAAKREFCSILARSLA